MPTATSKRKREAKQLRRQRHRFRRGSCLRKIAYRSAKRAHAGRRALEARGESDLVVYECKFCDGWHIGHKD